MQKDIWIFWRDGSREGLTGAELADALLVSQKVGYEDVWDLRNPCDVLESGKYSILSYEDAENIAFDAIHGPNNADAVVLGKYGDGGPTAYTSVAKDMDAQYFQLDNWDELAARYSDDEIWKINEKFLDIQTSSRREIYLSHNPEDYLGKGQFYSRELQYLLDSAIEKKDIFKIATEPTWDNLTHVNMFTGKTELTGFGREYAYLKKYGYYFDTVTKTMVK